jgi:hypothetical protein
LRGPGGGGCGEWDGGGAGHGYIRPSPTGRGSEPSMPLPSIRRPGGRASIGPAQLTVPGRAGTTGHNGGPGTSTTSCRAWHWHYRHRAAPCSCRAFSDRARAGPSCSCQMARYSGGSLLHIRQAHGLQRREVEGQPQLVRVGDEARSILAPANRAYPSPASPFGPAENARRSAVGRPPPSPAEDARRSAAGRPPPPPTEMQGRARRSSRGLAAVEMARGRSWAPRHVGFPVSARLLRIWRNPELTGFCRARWRTPLQRFR